MCMGSAPSIPAPPPPPPPPPVPALPETPDNGASGMSTDPRSRAIAAYGAGGTIATGPQGLTTAPQTTDKALLGS